MSLQDLYKKIDNAALAGDAVIDLDTGEVHTEEAPQPQAQEEKKKGRGNVIDRLKDWLNEHYVMLYNEITLDLEYLPSTGKEWRTMDERAENDLVLDALQEVGGGGIEKLLSKILRSSFVKGYDPIAEYFRKLEWDGKDRFVQWASTIKIEETAITYEHQGRDCYTTTVKEWPRLLRKWLMSSIHCGLGRGENQAMLLLIGGQGVGKTTWINKMCPKALQPYSHTGHIEVSLNSESTQNRLAEKFWLNVDDMLGNALHKDVQGMKGIVSAVAVTNRKKFHKSDKYRVRRANICGSVNEESLFSDHENRRYIAFKIKPVPAPIDWKASEAVNIDQLWAQLYYEYKTDTQQTWKIGPEDFAIINAMCANFTRPTPEEELLQKYFKKPTFDELQQNQQGPVGNKPDLVEYWMLTELQSYLQGKEKMQLYSRNLTNALQKLGWKASKQRVSLKQLARGTGGAGSVRLVYPVIVVES